jgi:hypothetical protein
MAKGILRDHQGTSPEDRRKFDRPSVVLMTDGECDLVHRPIS